MSRRFFRGFVPALLACLLGLAGCGRPQPPGPARPTDAGTGGVIGVSLLTLDNPFFKVIGTSIGQEAARHGYETVVVSAEKDLARQHAQVKDFIVKQVAAIVLSPCDAKGIVPAIQEANAAGIPVFTVDIPCLEPGVSIVAQVCTDNEQGGRLAGEALVEGLAGRPGKVAILHAKKFESCRLRVKGFRAVLDEHNAGSEAKLVVADEYESNGAKDIGYKAASDALQAHPDLGMTLEKVVGLLEETGAKVTYDLRHFRRDKDKRLGGGFSPFPNWRSSLAVLQDRTDNIHVQYLNMDELQGMLDGDESIELATMLRHIARSGYEGLLTLEVTMTDMARLFGQKAFLPKVQIGYLSQLRRFVEEQLA